VDLSAWVPLKVSYFAIHQTTNAGGTWENISDGLGNLFVLTMRFNPHDASNVLVGTHGGGVWSGELELAVTPGGGGGDSLPTDFNNDRTVDFEDFLLFVSGFGSRFGESSYNSSYDLNTDDVIDFSDFLLFASDFGKSI
jgi:NADH:ubiquinone oxidoreductase subunit F (NADH-binding)